MSAAAAIAAQARRLERWAAIGLGASLPISTALDGALLALLLAAWLAGGAWHEKWRAAADNPVAASALALFALIAAASLWGSGEPGEALHYLGKYADLLWIPLFLHALREAPARRLALHALAGALALVLLASLALGLGLLPKSGLVLGEASYPVVTKHRITHNVLMAFGAFLFAQLALEARASPARLAWGALALLAAVNVAAMVPGATGYVVLAVLAARLGWRLGGRTGLAAAAAACALAAALLASVPGPFQQRVSQIAREVGEWEPGRANPDSSVGLRLEFYRVSLAIVRDHPLLGVGTGSFSRAYAERAGAGVSAPVRNPHNEYLLVAAQTGLAGLALLLHLLWRQWRLAPRLASPLERELARALVLAFAAGCLFNSLLLDHTEGLLYAWLTGALFAGLQSAGGPRGPGGAS
jgi:O-antigen ligase